jgi:N-formylglutamate deformylase
MNTNYHFSKGQFGVLISMPHNGQSIPCDVAQTMTEVGQKVPDTDWYMAKLYDFAQQ